MHEPLEEAVLHVANTRPALVPWIGLPVEVFSPLFVLSCELGMVSWKFAVFSLPLWAIAAIIVRRDYNAGRVWIAWARTTAASFDGWHWGGSAVSHFPIRAPKRYRGIAPDAW